MTDSNLIIIEDSKGVRKPPKFSQRDEQRATGRINRRITGRIG